MRLSEIDWSVLRGAMVGLALSVLASGAIFYAAFEFSEGVSREHQQRRAQLQRAQGEYQAVDEEQQVMDAYLPRFRALEEQGVVGEERRLDWVEALRDAAARLKLPSLRYEIAQQEVYEPELPLPESAFEVHASSMFLEMGLLHEGDLIAVLRELDRNASGLYSVSSCDLRRGGSGIRMEPKAENVLASCELRWFTVRKPEEDEAG